MDSVPMPPPVLMAQATEPDCRVQAARAVPPAPAKRDASDALETKRAAADVTGTDFENEAAGSDDTAGNDPKDIESAASRSMAADVAKAESPPDPQNTEIKRLEQERDCYKRAEQLARKRLEALQASSAETIAALNQFRNGRSGPGHVMAR